MLLGYMACSNYGTTHHLTDPKAPRKQLLKKCGRQHAQKFYFDTTAGETKHVGYIIGGEWFTLYEVHEWTNLKGGE
jgi:hypothetical protein